jgi:preprotein translocase subunit SecA
MKLPIKSNKPFEAPVDKQKGSKPFRNRPCPCRSGKKYKHCCGKKNK